MGTITGLTLEMCQAQLNKYLIAEEKVLLGQSYDIDGKKVTRADLEFIQKGIEIWSNRCYQYGDIENSGMVLHNVKPGRH